MYDANFFQHHGLGEYMADLFENMPGYLYFVKDGDLRLVAMNERLAKKISNDDNREVLGLTDFDYLPVKMATNYKVDDVLVLETGEPIVNKVELVTRGNGFVDWSTTTKTALRDTKGEIVGIIGVTRPFSPGEVEYDAFDSLSETIKLIQERFNETLSADEMAKASNMSVSTLQRHFQKIFNMTPVQYVRHIRIQHACHLMVQSALTLSEIAQQCGFSDQSHFTREFSRIMNESPNVYRKRHLF